MWKRIKKIFFSLVGFLWLFSVCCLDSESNIPIIVCCITGVILVLCSWANNWFYDYDYKED